MSFSAVAATSASEAPVQALSANEARRIEKEIKRFVFNSGGPQAPEQKACREIAKKYLKFDQKRYKHNKAEIKSIVKKVRNLYKLKQHFMQGAACDANAAPSGGLHTSDTVHGASATSTTRGNAQKEPAKLGKGAPRNEKHKRASSETQAMPSCSASGIDDDAVLGFPTLVHDKFYRDETGEYDYAGLREHLLARGFVVAAGVVSPGKARAAADALIAKSNGKEPQVPGAGGCSLAKFGLPHVKEVAKVRCDAQLVEFCAKLWDVDGKKGPIVQFRVLSHAPGGYDKMPEERADTLRHILQTHGLCIPAKVLEEAKLADLKFTDYMPHYEDQVVVLECPVVASLDCVALRKPQKLDKSTQRKMMHTIVDSETKFSARANSSLKAHIDVNKSTATPGFEMQKKLAKFALGRSIQGILRLGDETTSGTILLPDHGLDTDFPRPEHMKSSKRDKVDMTEEFYAEYGQLFRSIRMSPGDYLVICSDTVHANQATDKGRQDLMVTFFPRGAYTTEQLKTFGEEKKLAIYKGDTFTHWPGAKNGATNSGGGHMSQKKDDPDAFQPLYHKEAEEKLERMKKMSKDAKDNEITRELVERYGAEIYAGYEHVL